MSALIDCTHEMIVLQSQPSPLRVALPESGSKICGLVISTQTRGVGANLISVKQGRNLNVTNESKLGLVKIYP